MQNYNTSRLIIYMSKNFLNWHALYNCVMNYNLIYQIMYTFMDINEIYQNL